MLTQPQKDLLERMYAKEGRNRKQYQHKHAVSFEQLNKDILGNPEVTVLETCEGLTMYEVVPWSALGRKEWYQEDGRRLKHRAVVFDDTVYSAHDSNEGLYDNSTYNMECHCFVCSRRWNRRWKPKEGIPVYDENRPVSLISN